LPWYAGKWEQRQNRAVDPDAADLAEGEFGEPEVLEAMLAQPPISLTYDGAFVYG
jgi:hypothetical protein